MDDLVKLLVVGIGVRKAPRNKDMRKNKPNGTKEKTLREQSLFLKLCNY